jgi:peptidoglycan hydrolase CwlO-like protein
MPVFDKEKIEKLMKPQKINELKGKEHEIVHEMPKLQKEIEDTKSDIVWQ